MTNYVHTEEDYNALLDAFYNYLGHRNTFPQSTTDNLLKKALQIKKPELAFPLIGAHAELLMHPQARIVRNFMKAVVQEDDYEKLKAFFEVTKGRYFLKRPDDLNKTVIEKAFEAGDKETVIEAYLDILDYEQELKGADQSLFESVLESMSYEEAIDHVLFGQVKEQMEARGFPCKLYSALYYLHANGGLTAADLIKEIASDKSVSKIPNSELFKTQFIAQVLPGEDAEDQNPLKLDASVLEQLQLALKQCKDKIDTEFYESAAYYLNPAPAPEPEAKDEEDVSAVEGDDVGGNGKADGQEEQQEEQQ